MGRPSSNGIKLIAENRKARRNYEISETYEAGLVLVGTEVKSLREGKVQLKDAYAKVRGGEVFLVGLHIAPYSHGTHDNHDPLRDRKLLLHRREIRRLAGKLNQRGYSLVALRLYFRRGLAKLALGLGRGKRHADRRRDLKERAVRREMEQAVKRSRSGE